MTPEEADAATLLPTIESSPNPSRRLTSRATEFSFWSCVELDPPSDVVLPPERCCERSKLSWMPSALVSAADWLRCIESRSVLARVSDSRAFSEREVAWRSLKVKVVANRLRVAW
jgi:hypothetical protein